MAAGTGSRIGVRQKADARNLDESEDSTPRPNKSPPIRPREMQSTVILDLGVKISPFLTLFVDEHFIFLLGAGEGFVGEGCRIYPNISKF